jgi:aminopeptidase
VEALDAVVTVWADVNTRSRSRLDPERERARKAAQGRLVQRMREREAEGGLRWCGVLYPTAGHAQDAELTLGEYADLLLGACHLDEADPAAWWRGFAERLARRARMLEGVRELRIAGAGTDVTLSVAGRPWVVGDGSQNMPDGEVFTCPVETSASGEVAFSFPGVHDGHLLDGVRLQLEGGRVVAADARAGKAYLDALLALDDGASRIGEVAFGMNLEITRSTGHIALDEKIGGTMHLALGRGFAEGGGSNQSALHLDLVIDLRDGGEVYADGAVIYRNGVFLDEAGEAGGA